MGTLAYKLKNKKIAEKTFQCISELKQNNAQH